jgi:hypothetical protein
VASGKGKDEDEGRVVGKESTSGVGMGGCGVRGEEDLWRRKEDGPCALQARDLLRISCLYFYSISALDYDGCCSSGYYTILLFTVYCSEHYIVMYALLD